MITISVCVRTHPPSVRYTRAMYNRILTVFLISYKHITYLDAIESKCENFLIRMPYRLRILRRQ